MKMFFALVGAGTLALAFLGAIGIGHFYIYYGPQELKCAKAEGSAS